LIVAPELKAAKSFAVKAPWETIFPDTDAVPFILDSARTDKMPITTVFATDAELRQVRPEEDERQSDAIIRPKTDAEDPISISCPSDTVPAKNDCNWTEIEPPMITRPVWRSLDVRDSLTLSDSPKYEVLRTLNFSLVCRSPSTRTEPISTFCEPSEPADNPDELTIRSETLIEEPASIQPVSEKESERITRPEIELVEPRRTGPADEIFPDINSEAEI
jgi:hypothetical protein